MFKSWFDIETYAMIEDVYEDEAIDYLESNLIDLDERPPKQVTILFMHRTGFSVGTAVLRLGLSIPFRLGQGGGCASKCLTRNRMGVRPILTR